MERQKDGKKGRNKKTVGKKKGRETEELYE